MSCPSSEKLKAILDNSTNAVFFGGAGVSTESGIPDFRSPNGLYVKKTGIPPETILSHDFFIQHTEEFFEFYRSCMLTPYARPNPAHLALARLEEWKKIRAIVTQNIDALHTKAGSKNVFELHGCTQRNTCLKCGKKYGSSFIENSKGVPHCSCGGIIKPDVVLYGENLDNQTVNGAIQAIAQADTLIVAGTSLTVYPAAGMLYYFQGKELVLINKTETPMDNLATTVIREPVGEVFDKLMELYS